MNTTPRLWMLVPFILWLLATVPLQAASGSSGASSAAAALPEGSAPFAQKFIKDYQTYGSASLGPWINPRRGLIDNRQLKTRDQVLTDFAKTGAALKNYKVTYTFGHGAFQGDNFYKALYLQTGGSLPKMSVRLNFICAFERIGGQWYLVQTHSYTQTSSVWLMVGDPIVDDSLVGTTLGGRRFSLSMAVARRKPVLLSFFDQGKDIFIQDNVKHVKLVHQWYSELRTKPIYVMNVNEAPPAVNREYLQLNKINMPLITDEGSHWHKGLQADIHPYLILLDKDGIVRALHRPTEGLVETAPYSLFRQIVSDVVAETPAAKSDQNSVSGPVDPSSKF